MPARNDLTAFQQHVLVILAEEPRYGLAIKRELEDLYGEEVYHGRLYPNLDDLVDAGLVEKSELDKRTNQYELTDLGELVLRKELEWRAHMQGFTVVDEIQEGDTYSGPMVTREGSLGRVVLGPDPIAYQEWEQQREEADRDD